MAASEDLKRINDELHTKIKQLSDEIVKLKTDNQMKDSIIKSLEKELESVLKLTSSSKQKRTQPPEKEKEKVLASRGVIGIIGAGKMGTQLASLLSLKRYEIVIIDRQKAALQKSKAMHHTICNSYFEQKLVSKHDIKSAKISFCESLSDVSKYSDSMRFIIDTSHDQYKRQVLAQTVKHINKKCIIITNSTKKCLTEVASYIAADYRPNLIGINLLWFELWMQCNECIEIMPSWTTSIETINKCKDLVSRDLNRACIVLQDSCSFVSNRLFAVYVNEAFHILAAKLCSARDLDQIQTLSLREGHSAGPFALADKIGLNVIKEILDELHREYGEQKYVASTLLKQYVRSGKWGQNLGVGVYSYKKGKK